MGRYGQVTMQALWRCAEALQIYLNKPLDMQSNAKLESIGMDEREYRKIKEDLQADYKRKLEALELLWSGLRDKPTDKPELRPAQSMTDIVRQALPNLGEQFSIFEVRKEIERMFPALKGAYRTTSLSSTLTRMHQRHEIEVIREGKGTAPTIYRRKPGTG